MRDSNPQYLNGILTTKKSKTDAIQSHGAPKNQAQTNARRINHPNR
jgi:hypothetical protein